MPRVIVYEEPNIRFCEPLPNDWHFSALELKRQLIEAGFDVFGEHETTPDPEHDVAIYLDALLRPQHPPLHKKSLYISLEPPVVNARFYERINGWPYTRILTFSRECIDDKRIFYLPYPNVKYERKDNVHVLRTGNMCAITANKRNTHPEELYTARRDIYRALGPKLDLYGKGWAGDPICDHVNYRGPCDHIFDVYQRYKIAISIENQYLEGYASEKYWTPLQAGCELMRIGWKSDYPLADCDSKAWAQGITRHVTEIV